MRASRPHSGVHPQPRMLRPLRWGSKAMNEETKTSTTYRCRICGTPDIPEKELRDHLIEHSSCAEDFSWEKVLDNFIAEIP